MAYQLSDLITSIQSRAKDTSFSSSLITEYLNETQSEVLGHRRFSFMETADTDTLSAGQNELELDDEVQTILYLAFVVNGADRRPEYLPARTFYETDFSQVQSQPAYFTFVGRSIIFSSFSDVAYTVKYQYTRRPATLANDTDVPEIPEDYRELLIRGALARIEEYRENYDIAAIHQRKIEELSEDMNLRYGIRQLITAPRQTRRSFRRASR
jgi:hypothetical protein